MPLSKVDNPSSEQFDSQSIVQTLVKLNQLIDERQFTDFWYVGVELLCRDFGAQFASLHLTELPKDLDTDTIRIGEPLSEIMSRIDFWEESIDAQPSVNGSHNSSLPPYLTHSEADWHAINFPFVFNSVPRGALTFVWQRPEPFPRAVADEVHQLVQLFGSNGMRANQLLLTHSDREGSDLLYMIAQELTSTLDLTTVLNKATETVRTVLNAQAATLFSVDSGHKDLIFMIPKGDKASELEKRRMPMGQGVVGWVATHGKPLIVNDTSTSSLFHPSLDSETGFKTRNILCVPLLIQDETVGVLEVLNKEGGIGFTPEDEEWLTRIGSQVAIAFENAQLFEKERARADELDTLNAVSQTINSELDVSVILDKITQSVFDILSANRSELLLVSPDRRYLNLVSSAGLKADNAEIDWQLPINKGIPGWCVENNLPVTLGRVGDDERYVAWPDLQPLGGFSVAAVPLTHRDKVIGAIAVYSVSNRPYDNDKLDLLQTFANQASISLRNAELYQSLRVEQERIIRAQEEVRHQLARDLHDNTAQMLSFIIMNLDLTRKMLTDYDIDKIRAELDRLEELARQANREIRTLLFELRPIILESRGLIPALHSYNNQLNQSMSSKIHLDAKPLGFQIKLAGASTIFTIIQEAVNNIRKHAKASNIWIQIKVNEENLTFCIEDDGIGFDFDTTIENYDGRGSFGLLNMHERAVMLEGGLEINSPRPGHSQGTCVVGYIPISVLRDDETPPPNPIFF